MAEENHRILREKNLASPRKILQIHVSKRVNV